MSIAATTSERASVALDPDVQREIEEQRARGLRRLAERERLSLFVSTGAFVGVAGALALLVPSDRDPSAGVVLLLIAAYAVAFRLDFELRTGLAVPTQLILVPMFFLLPPAAVPAAVAAGIVAGSLAEAVRGELHLERAVLLRLVNAWHSLGPALVLVVAGETSPDLADWPLYLVAMGAQFAFDFASAAAREWFALGVRPKVQLTTMFSVYAIDVALAPIGLAVAFAAAESPVGVVLALPLIGLLAVFSRERRGRIDRELELRDAYRGTAMLLGDVVEADDAYTGSHSRDVVKLALAVGESLGLSGRERRDAEFAALLHDVGKVRVPNEIINKPGPLTAEERAVIETHTLEGERMLHRVGGLLGSIGNVVRSCHERYDGSGYPDGLAGEQIPLLARIVACCDAFNAMTTERPYRNALSPEEAIAELERSRGSQFDPRVVDALLAVVERDGASPHGLS